MPFLAQYLLRGDRWGASAPVCVRTFASVCFCAPSTCLPGHVCATGGSPSSSAAAARHGRTATPPATTDCHLAPADLLPTEPLAFPRAEPEMRVWRAGAESRMFSRERNLSGKGLRRRRGRAELGGRPQGSPSEPESRWWRWWRGALKRKLPRACPPAWGPRALVTLHQSATDRGLSLLCAGFTFVLGRGQSSGDR